MKKLGILLLGIAMVGLLVAGDCFAVSEVNINAQAVIDSYSPSITVVIRKFTDGNPDDDPWTNSTEVSSMDFDTLVSVLTGGGSSGLWYSTAGFCVVIYTQPYGKPYEVKSTCYGLVGQTTGATLPAGSFGLTPIYSKFDKWVWDGGWAYQGDMPAGASLGSAGPAIATDKLIYSSETGTATARIIQAYYGLPPYKTGGVDPHPGFVPIPLTQAADTYKGIVTITISQK